VRLYRLNDTVCSLSLGILSLLAQKLAARLVRHPRTLPTSVSLAQPIPVSMCRHDTTRHTTHVIQLVFFPYVYVWEHFAVTRVFAANGALAWWLMFLGKEFTYYCTPTRPPHSLP
jgi:hypothetical protein